MSDKALREAAQAVIEWEEDYRTRNNLGRVAPYPFIQLEAALITELAAGAAPGSGRPTEDYPGQAFFHKHNPNIKATEERAVAAPTSVEASDAVRVVEQWAKEHSSSQSCQRHAQEIISALGGKSDVQA